MISYALCRMRFGNITSPLILIATLQYLVSQNAPELFSKSVDQIQR